MAAQKAIALVTSIAVLIGLGDLPFGYYTLLRLLICGFSLFLLFNERPIRVEWQRWLTGGWAVLYNPIVPVRIGDKGIWIVLNLLTVAWFWYIATRPSREMGA
jgi:hypothetical protein